MKELEMEIEALQAQNQVMKNIVETSCTNEVSLILNNFPYAKKTRFLLNFRKLYCKVNLFVGTHSLQSRIELHSFLCTRASADSCRLGNKKLNLTV